MAKASAKLVSKAVARVERDIIPVSEATPYCKILVYGRNGKRKTRFAASGPKTLIVDINEEGTKSVRQYPDTYVYHVKKWEQLSWVYWYLKAGKHEFETVVIDTLTAAQQLCMKHLLKEAEDRDPNRPPSMPRRQDWGQMTETMKPIIYDYRNLPMHVVFVCQERIDKSSDEDDDEEITIRRVPDLSPGVRAVAMGAVEIMGRMYVRDVKVGDKKTKKTKRVSESRMLVGDHDDYETKDRTGQLGYIVRNPNMQMMIEASAYIPQEEEE
jgi:hypothetical protein